MHGDEGFVAVAIPGFPQRRIRAFLSCSALLEALIVIEDLFFAECFYSRSGHVLQILHLDSILLGSMLVELQQVSKQIIND